MNNLKLFDFENQRLRIVKVDGEPWFVGKDVAKILGYSQPSVAISKNVPSKDKGIVEMETPGGKQKTVIISEPGMYKLVFKSHAPNAQRFNDYVSTEVLPTIRRHGVYMTDEKIEEVLTDPDTIIKLATQLKDEREHGYLINRKGSDWNMPTQKAMNLGLFKIKETTINHSNGTTSISKTPKVTGKGQQYFINKFLKAKKPQSLKITANENGISSKDKNGKFGINSDGSVY